MYDPEVYGIFALFNAFSANLGLFVTLNFTNAFVLPKKEGEFYALARLTFLCILVTTAISLVVIGVASDSILAFFNAEKLGHWIFLVPLFAAFNGFSVAWTSWNIRLKEFGRSAGGKTLSIVLSKSFTLGVGYLTSGAVFGIIGGEFINRLLNTVLLSGKKIRNSLSKVLFGPGLTAMAAAGKKYKEYPIYALPANWLAMVIDQLPIFALARYFGPEFSGYLSFAYSLLNIPITLIGNSTGQVFLQKAAEVGPENPERLRDLTIRLFNKLLILGLGPFCIVAVFGDLIFPLLLGDEWYRSGIFASYLAFFYYFRLQGFPIASIYRVLRKEKYFFYINVLSFTITLGALYLGVTYDDPDTLIKLFSVAGALTYISSAALTFYLLRARKGWWLLLKSGLAIAAAYLLLSWLRVLIIG
ncbi:MAG: oligosaccharide flippase family protein [Cyclobacteriaceae bacterium]